MATTSTVMTALVLGLTLMSVVSFAVVYQQVRYSYLMRMASMIARTEEAVSVGGWKSGTYLVIDVKNEGGTGVFIREIRIAVQMVLYIVSSSGNIHTTSKSLTLTNGSIHIPPLKRVYLTYDLSHEVPSYATSGEISFVSVMITTEKNVFIFDVVPPTDTTVLSITRDDIDRGVTYSIPLPNGRVAYLKPYEILFCAVGPSSRNNAVIPRYDSSGIIITAGGNVMRGIYHYGYDPTNRRWGIASITFDWQRLPTENKILTVCSISTPPGERIPAGSTVVVARGILLLGTQLSGYDVGVVLFARNQYPEFYTPQNAGRGNRVTITNVRTNILVLKIGLPSPSSDIDVYDFIGSQVVPILLNIQNRTSIYSVGTYYSEAILILQVIYGSTERLSDDIDVNVYFSEPYPVAVIISTIADAATI